MARKVSTDVGLRSIVQIIRLDRAKVKRPMVMLKISIHNPNLPGKHHSCSHDSRKLEAYKNVRCQKKTRFINFSRAIQQQSAR